MKGKKPYTGVLKERMDYPLSDLPEAGRQFAERVAALFEHYGVDMWSEGSGLELALKLAQDHVQGFKCKPPRDGRPIDPAKEWRDVTILAELSVASHLNRSVRKTARQLAKDHPEWDLKWESIRDIYNRKMGDRRGVAGAVEVVADMIRAKSW